MDVQFETTESDGFHDLIRRLDHCALLELSAFIAWAMSSHIGLCFDQCFTWHSLQKADCD